MGSPVSAYPGTTQPESQSHRTEMGCRVHLRSSRRRPKQRERTTRTILRQLNPCRKHQFCNITGERSPPHHPYTIHTPHALPPHQFSESQSLSATSPTSYSQLCASSALLLPSLRCHSPSQLPSPSRTMESHQIRRAASAPARIGNERNKCAHAQKWRQARSFNLSSHPWYVGSPHENHSRLS